MIRPTIRESLALRAINVFAHRLYIREDALRASIAERRELERKAREAAQ